MLNSLTAERTNHVENKTYFREYVKLVGFFTCLFLLLSIASFNPSDPTSFSVGSEMGRVVTRSENVFGSVGATIADWGWQFFGLGALVFTAMFCAQILSTFQKPTMRSRVWIQTLGYPQLALSYLGLMQLLQSHWKIQNTAFLTGGTLGYWVAKSCSAALGNWGATLLLSFGVIASLPLCFGIRPTEVLMGLFRKLRLLDTDEMFVSNEKPPTKITLPELLKKESPVKVPALNSELNTEFKASRIGRFEVGTIDGYKAPNLDDPAGANPLTSKSPRMVGSQDFENLLALMEEPKASTQQAPEVIAAQLEREALVLEEKLGQFGVLGKVLKSQPGPVVNVHEFEPAAGIKVTKVLALQDDLALGLKAQSVLMAPQPGKSTIGIEIPSILRETVPLKRILSHTRFRDNMAPLPMVIGSLVDGSPLVADLAAMPHLLIAGSTGSGKSVGINVSLLSLMMNRTPDRLRLILVDPKMLELSNYDGIGHLLMPVVTDPQKAAGALKWAIDEMERRYRLMKHAAVRNIGGFNTEIENGKVMADPDTGKPVGTLPYLVVVIDELCDLMMTAPKDVEDSIQRLAQKARAAGIHLILATQRPSVDVLTGVIKANLPCRISFQVASKHDSRTIIETVGAERLLGKGDMLFLPPGTSKLVRAHGAYVGDKEINSIADRLRELYPTRYEASIIDEVEKAAVQLGQKSESKNDDGVDGNSMDENALFLRSVEFAVMAGTVSTSSLQRNFRIGYNRAARIMDRMDKEGLVGPSDVAGKPRAVLPTARAVLSGN